MKIAIVVADFNSEVTHVMLDRAVAHAAELGAEISRVVHVPGVFDMGPIVKRLLSRGDVDGVVMIGAVIKGETLHDELISQIAARIGAELSIEYGKPVGLGITGPGMMTGQAIDRIDNARHAVEAVVRVFAELAALDK
jgi:6,7-dimethyl-8-ribityllumazine synthase